MSSYEAIARIILKLYPATQAIYLFGSYGTADEWPDSDIDLAVLLPPVEAKQAGFLGLSETRFALEEALGKEVDLLNLRQVSTVLQKQVIMAERRLFCADALAADEFEVMVMGRYQKLNEERAEILAEGLRSGRFYDV